MAGEHIQDLRTQIINSRVTQTFGATGFEKWHNGIDMPLDGLGTPVRSPMTGTVEVRDDGSAGFGKHVIIHGANNWAVLMGHLQRDGITTNRQILAGETIGKEGSTGYSTGAHVHYALYPPGHSSGGYNSTNYRSSVDPTLGVPAESSSGGVPHQRQARDNFFYAIRHDLGFGSGSDYGHSSLDQTAPAQGEVRAATDFINGRLNSNPGNVQDPPPVPNPNPTPQPVPPGATHVDCSTGTCPEGQLLTYGGSDANGGWCYCATPDTSGNGQNQGTGFNLGTIQWPLIIAAGVAFLLIWHGLNRTKDDKPSVIAVPTVIEQPSRQARFAAKHPVIAKVDQAAQKVAMVA